MTSHWQREEEFTIDAGDSARFELYNNNAIERLTVWAVSANAELEDIVFQPEINRVSFGAPTNVVDAVAADLIYNSGGSAHENAIIPKTAKLKFSVLITNNGATAATVTLIACGNQHTG